MKGKRKMKKILKNNYKFLIFLAFFGIVGGYFTALYSIQTIDPVILEQTIAQLGSIDVVIVITTIQSLGYALVLGILGKILANKIGLWRPLTFIKKGNLELCVVVILGGAAFILVDHLFFANFSNVIKNSYALPPTPEYIIASITYGSVIEEVMLRLFLMSLLAFIFQKLSKRHEVDDKILIIANVISAAIFATGHLPATVISIGITPMILLRCFVMNGGFGLLLGRLYRKYGIHYAMIGHAGLHIVSKLIWILFI